MVKQFKKGEGTRLSNNFTSSDFDCKCTNAGCNYTLVDTDLVDGLDALSDLFAKLNIHSGFRCTVHNAQVAGKPGSMHLVGKAADISSHFADPREMFYAADKIKIFHEGGMGIYYNFIHVDCRGYRSRWNEDFLKSDLKQGAIQWVDNLESSNQ